MLRGFSIIFIAALLMSCAPTETDPKPEPNCRVPVDPTVSVGVGVGTGGLRTGGAVVFDASGNNGVLDEDGNCVLIEGNSKVRIGIGF
ncbi:MAG: hypothetical protein AAF198_06015 [Pseudomonadota bacterium]